MDCSAPFEILTILSKIILTLTEFIHSPSISLRINSAEGFCTGVISGL